MDFLNASDKKGKENIVLIGMPGSGKSTTGVLLAKSIGFSFSDTDLLIQRQTNMLLQEIADSAGFSGFIEIEENIISGIQASKCVISTGGSAIYGEKSMARLKEIGIIVFLDVAFPEITRRIQNISTRGIALKAGQSLETLYEERRPLYQKYADIIVSGDNKTVEELVTEIIEKLQAE
ncbi:MAG: shikimate kinase [Methanosarcinales archaeon]|jgi:shikimate kinase|nr:shikimate kinase [Methanosarcinales archaeon]